MPTDRFGGQVMGASAPTGVDRFGGKVMEPPPPIPESVPPPAPPAPPGSTWGGAGQSAIQGAADLVPVGIPSLIGLPGSTINTVAELLTGEPKGFEQTGIMGVPDYQALLRKNKDLAMSGFTSPATPVNELPPSRYTPQGTAEQMAEAGGAGLMGGAASSGAMLRMAAEKAPAMTSPIANALDDLLVNAFRKNPVAATAIETSAGAGAGAGGAGAPEIPLPFTDKNLGDMIGQGPASLIGSLFGGIAAPASGTLIRRADQRILTPTINAGAKALGATEKVIPPTGILPEVQAAGQRVLGAQPTGGPLNLSQITPAEKQMAEYFLQNEGQVDDVLGQVDTLNQKLKDLGIIGPNDQGLRPTVGQTLNDPALLTQERDIGNAAIEGTRLRDQTVKNEKLLEKAATSEAARFDQPGADVTTFGPRLQERLAPEVQAERAAIEAPAKQAEQRLQDQIGAVDAQRMPAAEAGLQARDALQQSTDDITNQYKEKFQQAEEKGLKTITSDTPNFKATLEQQAARAQESNVPALTEGSLRSAQKSLDRVDPAQAQPAPTNEMRDIPGPEDIPPAPRESNLDTIQNDLSNLKRAVRSVATSSDPGQDPRMYNQQISALSQDFDEAAERAMKSAEESGDPSLLQAVKEGRALRAKQAAVYESENPISKTLKVKDSQGNFRVADKDILPTLLKGNKKDVEQYLEIMRDPKFGSQRDATRKGLADLYVDYAVKDGKVNPARHQQFMKDYGDAGKELWGDQWSQVSTLKNMQDQALKLGQSRDVALKNFNQQLKTRLSGSSDVSNILPEKVYSTLSSADPATRLATVQAYKLAVAKNHPDLWNEFVSLRKDDILNDIRGTKSAVQRKVGENYRPLSEENIDKLLGDPNRVKELDALFGPEYKDSLADLSSGLKIFRRNHASVREPAGDKVMDRALAAMRIFTGQLSSKGQVLTVARNELELAATKMQARMIEDPRMIRQVAQLLKAKDISGNKKALRLIAQLGGIEFLDKPEDDKVKQTGDKK